MEFANISHSCLQNATTGDTMGSRHHLKPRNAEASFKEEPLDEQHLSEWQVGRLPGWNGTLGFFATPNSGGWPSIWDLRSFQALVKLYREKTTCKLQDPFLSELPLVFLVKKSMGENHPHDTYIIHRSLGSGG